MITVLILLFSLVFTSNYAYSNSLDNYEKTCKDIGFKPKTEKFGDCVLELRKRDLAVTESPPYESSNQPTQSSKAKGDGSYEDLTCQKYGFGVATTEYSQCRLQLHNARKQLELQQAQFQAQQEQYMRQKADYDARVAEYEKEKERQNSLRLIRYGLGLMNGESPVNAYSSALGFPPVAPQIPAFQDYTIRMPNGRVTNCTYATSTRSMNCF